MILASLRPARGRIGHDTHKFHVADDGAARSWGVPGEHVISVNLHPGMDVQASAIFRRPAAILDIFPGVDDGGCPRLADGQDTDHCLRHRNAFRFMRFRGKPGRGKEQWPSRSSGYHLARWPEAAPERAGGPARADRRARAAGWPSLARSESCRLAGSGRLVGCAGCMALQGVLRGRPGGRPGGRHECGRDWRLPA